MKFLNTRKTIVLSLLLAGAGALALTRWNPSTERAPRALAEPPVENPDTITESQEDGSRVEWRRLPDGRTLTKRKFTREGALAHETIYRLNATGSPISCKTLDDHGTPLLKSSYGYRKSDGTLAEERIFDQRNRNHDENGVEKPIRRIIYQPDPVTGNTEPRSIDLAAYNFPADLHTAFRNPFGNQGAIPR